MVSESPSFAHAARVVDEAVASGSHPCGLVAVADGTQTHWTHIVPGGEGVSADSIFLLASITKPMLATGVMRLVEQGRLLIEKPVSAYLPEFSGGAKDTINAWHLLTHTSGLDETEWMNTRMCAPDDGRHCFEHACAAPIAFEPGSRCSYCTLSFAVMSELITRLSGKPYPDFVRDEVFEPLGMPDTAFEPVDPARAAFVHDMGGAEVTARFTARKVAGGGIWSTLGDLMRFGQAFLRGGALGGRRILSLATVSWMTRNHTLELHQLVEGKPAPFITGWAGASRHRTAARRTRRPPSRTVARPGRCCTSIRSTTWCSCT